MLILYKFILPDFNLSFYSRLPTKKKMYDGGMFSFIVGIVSASLIVAGTGAGGNRLDLWQIEGNVFTV